LSHIVWRSWIQNHLSGCGSWPQDVGQGCRHVKAWLAGGPAFQLTQMAVEEDSVLHLQGFYAGLHMTWKLASSKTREYARKRWSNQGGGISIFNNLISEVKYHYFYSILWITPGNHCTVWQVTTLGVNTRRQGSLGALLEASYNKQ
jgi:hypothetical protein